jgi:hypothetical protein
VLELTLRSDLRSVFPRRSNPVEAYPQSRQITRFRKLDCLARQRFGLAVKQRLNCKCRLVARTFGLSRGIAALSGVKRHLWRCIRVAFSMQDSSNVPPNFVLLDAALPDVAKLVAAMVQGRCAAPIM